MKKLYGIWDRIAGTLAGPIMTHANDASAVRTFTDVAIDPKTSIAQHITDYELHYLGQLQDAENHCHIIHAESKIIITGTAWRDMQNSAADHRQLELLKEAK